MTESDTGFSEPQATERSGSAEQPQSPMQRCFIALDVPAEVMPVLRQQVALLKREPSLSSLRWIPGKNWHLTLAFLGDQSLHDLELLWSALSAALAGYPRVQAGFSAVSGFPDAKSAILAARVEPAEGLLALRSQVYRICLEQGMQLDRRRYKPHVTLARSHNRQPVCVSDRSFRIPAAWNRLTLYISQLTPSGSVYTPFRSLSLE